MVKEPLADRFFRGLLRILPFDFRSEFGDEMEETFREHRAATGAARAPRACGGCGGPPSRDILRMAPARARARAGAGHSVRLRMMRKNRGFTLGRGVDPRPGIGVNTSIFSVVNSVLLRELPYAQGNQLVSCGRAAPRPAWRHALEVEDLNDYRKRNRTLSDLVEYHSMTFTLLGGDRAAPGAHRRRLGTTSSTTWASSRSWAGGSPKRKRSPARNPS